MQAMPQSPGATFQYGYMAITCTATLDASRLLVKQGIRKFEVPLASVRQLFVQQNAAGAYLTLYLATEPAPGKKKVFRFLANAGQPQFDAMVHALLPHLAPGGDLRALDDKAALKTMGARDVDKLVGAIFFALVMLLSLVGLSPKLVHGLDFGSQDVTAEQLGDGAALESRNLTITKAKALTGWALAVTTISKKNGVETGRSTSDYVPIVPKNWERDEPVHIVLETKHGADLDLKEFEGIARNVWWEGLSDEKREWFKKKIGVTLAKDAILLQHRAKSSTDLWTYVGVNAALAGLGVLIGWTVIRKKKQKAK